MEMTLKAKKKKPVTFQRQNKRRQYDPYKMIFKRYRLGVSNE